MAGRPRTRARKAHGRRRRNRLLRVPETWIDAIWKAYKKGGGTVYLDWHDLAYATPGSRIEKGLAKLYPDGKVKVKLRLGSATSVLGSVAYPKHGGSLSMFLAHGIKRSTAVHETRHVIQHLGDMALRATMTAKEKARVAKSKKGKLSGRFGRPSKATVASMRGWKEKAKRKYAKTGKRASRAAWYYRSASEYVPHTGDAAAAALRWLKKQSAKGKPITDAMVRKAVRYVVTNRPLFQHLTPSERRHAMSNVYVEVMEALNARGT